MTFIVDASIAIAWCFDDENASAVADIALDRLASEGAVAPAHWPLEVANALRTAERRRRLAFLRPCAPRRAAGGTPRGAGAGPGAHWRAIYGVLEVAREQGLTAYDAAYLDLAAARGLPLATVDERLRQALRSVWGRRARRLTRVSSGSALLAPCIAVSAFDRVRAMALPRFGRSTS